VFFEDGDGDAGAGEEVAEHDARGSAANYAAGSFYRHMVVRVDWD
jgi:hypothetical protein